MLLLWMLLQADSVRELLERLTDDRVDVRAGAEVRLLDLPARLLPLVLEEAAKREEAEIRAAVDPARIGPAWAAFLPGTIREARGVAERIEHAGHPERGKAAAAALERLSQIPPAEASRLLLKILDEPAEGLRQFALAGLKRFPPADPQPLLPYLRDGRTSGLAAEILVAMGADTVVPVAVDLFCGEGAATLGAARILEAFGAGGQAPRIAVAVREHIGLLVWGIRILRATGADAEPVLIGLLPDVSTPRQKEIAEALAAIGGATSVPLLRSLAAPWPRELRDPLLWTAGDRDWALARFEDLRRRTLPRGADPLDALSELCGPAVAPDVREWIREEKDSALRAELVRFLGAVGSLDDLALLRGLGDGLEEAAADAIDRLGRPPRALPGLRERSPLRSPQLLELARGYDPAERRRSAEALGLRKEPSAVLALMRLADDPSPVPGTPHRVWHYAMAALEAVTGEKSRGGSTVEQRASWRSR